MPSNLNDEFLFKNNEEAISKIEKPEEKKFFKQQTVFTRIKNYFKRQQIQTQDSLDSNLKVATKDSLWYYSQLGWAWAWYEKNIAKLSIDRRRRYEEYNLMDQDAMIAGALDVYADECCSINVEDGATITVFSENQKVMEEVESCFFECLQLDEQVWGLIRDLCKFGDSPFEIVLNQDEDGIAKLIPIPLDGFYRIEEDRTLKGFEYRLMESMTDATANLDAQGVPQTLQKIEYEPFQVAHFTLKTNDPRLAPYGFSILEGARKTWKQLKIMEESLIINRLVRAPERRVFYIDVGNMGPAEVKTFINQIKSDYAKKNYFNAITGEIDAQASPLSQQEDFYVPIRESTTGQRGTRIETLPGACLALDTKIKCVDGRILSLQELINEYNLGKENWIYSIERETGSIKPGKITWAGVTRKNTDVVKITLDNNESVTTTLDHKFIKRDGSYCEAKDLKSGDSLMPLYTKIHNKYESILDLKENKYKQTYRIFAEEYFGHESLIGKVVHHKNYNQTDNSKENLDISMSPKEHWSFHSKCGENNKIKQAEWHKNNPEKTKARCSKMRDVYSQQAIDKANSFDFNELMNILTLESTYKSLAKHLDIQDASIRNRIKIEGYKNLRGIKKNKFGITRDLYKIQDRYINFKNNVDFIEFNELFNFVQLDTSINDLMNHFNVSKYTILRKIEESEYKFLRNIKKSKFNKFFTWKKEPVLVNHKVFSVEFLTEKRDTGTLTIDKWHNFAVSSGVFVKNSNMDQICDVNMFRDKILAALKIPPAYLGRLTGAPDGSTNIEMTKAGLSVLDKRFGRTIIRIQKAVIAQLYKLAYLQLYLKGFNAEEIKSLEIKMTCPSNMDELVRLELMNQRMAAASTAKSIMGMDDKSLLSDEYIYKAILMLTDDEVIEMKKQRMNEMPTVTPESAGGPTPAGGAAPAAGGIEGEFASFAKGKEGEVPPEEVKPGEETAEAPEEVGKMAGEPEIKEPEKVAESKYKYNKRANHFDYLLMEGQFNGLVTKNGKKVF